MRYKKYWKLTVKSHLWIKQTQNSIDRNNWLEWNNKQICGARMDNQKGRVSRIKRKPDFLEFACKRRTRRSHKYRVLIL